MTEQTTKPQTQQEYEIAHAAKTYDEAIEQAAQRLEEAATELRRSYASHRWTTAVAAHCSVKPGDIAAWAVNHLASNILPNLRLDLIARYGAECDRLSRQPAPGRYRIRASVTGGRTGTRESYLKQDGIEQVFPTFAAAEEVCRTLRETFRTQPSGVRFTYTPEQA